MLERDIERYLVKSVRLLGGHAYKFSSPGRRAVPDRSCHLPYGVHFYVECKAPGAELTELQRRELTRLRTLGARAYAVYSPADVDNVIAMEAENMHDAKAKRA